MKTTDASILALVATRKYYRAEIFKVTPLNGSGPFYWTSYGYPLTTGGHTYTAGMVIKRGSFEQSRGLAAPTLELTCAPKTDNPDVPVIGGVSFLTAVRQGVFRNADVQFSRIFMPTALDVSLGAVPFFTGRISQYRAGGMSATLTVAAYTELFNQQMPRNLIQAGCVHTLFDSGCTLSRATFQVSGSVSSVISTSSIATGLTQPNGYFRLGILTFTSGAMSGQSYTVKEYLNSSGTVTTIKPFASTPGIGDTFSISPGCPKTKAACSNTSTAVGPAFNNAAHFRGYRFVPTPETLYDGGTYNPPAPTAGGIRGPLAGSIQGAGSGRAYTP